MSRLLARAPRRLGGAAGRRGGAGAGAAPRRSTTGPRQDRARRRAAAATSPGTACSRRSCVSAASPAGTTPRSASPTGPRPWRPPDPLRLPPGAASCGALEAGPLKPMTKVSVAHPLLERPASPGDLPDGPRRPAGPRASSGRSWSSTTARRTAPRTGCARRWPGVPPDRAARSTSASAPATTGWCRFRTPTPWPCSTTTPVRSPAGWQPWWMPCARPRRTWPRSPARSWTGRASASTSAAGVMTFDGHAFQLDFRRPLDRGAGARGRGGAALRLRRQPAGPPELLPGSRRLRRGLLRLPGGRGPGLAPVVRRRAGRLRVRTRWSAIAPAPRATSWASSTAASSSSATPS